MRILRIVYDYPPPWWGLSPGPYELTTAQVGQGHRISVLAGGWPDQRSGMMQEVTVKRFLRTIPYAGIFATYSPLVLAHYLWNKADYDLIHAHNYFAYWYFRYRKMAHDRKRLVMHMHMTSAERAYRHPNENVLTRSIEWKLAAQAEKLGCSQAGAVICVSESVKNEVIRWYNVDPEKIHVIPNGVNTRLFSPVGHNNRDKLNLHDEKVILFVGRLYANKNVDLLIRSLAFLGKEYRLLIVGEGNDREKLELLVAETGLRERVLFAGYVPYRELPDYYRTADVFVLPSRLEGNPKVVLEALSSGVPIVMSKCFLPDPAVAKWILQIDALSPESIAKAVKDSLENNIKPDTGDIAARFDWAKTAEKVDEVYGKLE